VTAIELKSEFFKNLNRTLPSCSWGSRPNNLSQEGLTLEALKKFSTYKDECDHF